MILFTNWRPSLTKSGRDISVIRISQVIPSRGSGEGNIVGLVHDALRLTASRVSVVRGDLFVI
jgi:hypothetical protein